jgi:putative ABC transport system permease protein
MKNMPINSHLQADAVLPFFGYYKDCTWGWSDSFNTYLTLNSNTDFDKVEKALTEIYDTNMTSHLPDNRIDLQPLKDIHFSSGFMNDQVIKGNKSLVLIFILTAAIILIISCINFTNLFVSTSFIRAKTIGIKKAQGADKRILIYDFYKETAYYVILSIIIGLLLAFLSVPVFNQVMNTHIFIDFCSVKLYVFLFILFILTVLIAGSFPALYMTRFGIIETLREKFKGKKMSVFQKSLVILQFSASVTLLIIIFFFNKQIDYMISADMGFDRENVFYVEGRDNFGNNFESFRAEMLHEPTIKDVTMSRSPITEWRQGWSIKTIGKEETVLTEICRVKPNFFDFFNIKFIEGDNPLNTVEADSLWVGVVNQTSARLLELKNPIDKELITHNKRNTVIKGVIHDAQTRSFHTTVDPQAYFKLTQDKYNQIYFKVAGNPAKAIAFVENKWKEQITDALFEYHFLDDTYKQLYITETNAQKLLTYAMFISFFITMIGLFAISYYSLQQRVKEIGIRKVNGATLPDLLILLNKGFLIRALISFIIACPVSYFFVKNWLDNFTIKTPVDLWVFLLAGIFSLFVALFTVSYQTWKTANMNPVDAIQNE